MQTVTVTTTSHGITSKMRIWPATRTRTPPYIGGSVPEGPAKLRLTFANKRQAFPFIEALLRFGLGEPPGPDDPDEVLGTTTVVVIDSDGDPHPAGAYSPDSPYGLLLAELAGKDPSFAQWAERNRIDLERLVLLLKSPNHRQRASTRRRKSLALPDVAHEIPRLPKQPALSPTTP